MKKKTIRVMGTIALLTCLSWFVSCSQDISGENTEQEIQTDTTTTGNTETASKNEEEEAEQTDNPTEDAQSTTKTDAEESEAQAEEATTTSTEVSQLGKLMQIITFEETEGFAASSSYKIARTLVGTTSTWILSGGNVSTTNSIDGQSLLLRSYDTEVPITATTYTSISALCGIAFEAKRGFNTKNVKAAERAAATVMLGVACVAPSGETIVEKDFVLTDDTQTITLDFSPVDGMTIIFKEVTDTEESDAIVDNISFYASQNGISE